MNEVKGQVSYHRPFFISQPTGGVSIVQKAIYDDF